MKFLFILLVTIFLTGCDDISPCNRQYCDDGIITFQPCRGPVVILLDDNRQTIPCKVKP